MIAVYSVSEIQRQSIMKLKIIAIIALLIVTVGFAVPTIMSISNFVEYINYYKRFPLYDTNYFVAWIVKWVLALVLQVIAVIMYIVFSNKHSPAGAGGYIPAPHGVYH